MVERADLDIEVEHSPQRRRQRRRTDGPVAAVRDDDDIGTQVLVVPFEKLSERLGAGLLLTLDEHGHSDRELVAVSPDGGEVSGDPGLVVGGTASIQALATLRGDEGRTLPVALVARRLHVVVGIQEHGGTPHGCRLSGQDGRRGIPDRDQLDVEALGLEQVGDRGRGPAHVVGVLREQTHAGNCDESLEIGADRGQHGPQAVAQGR